MKGLIVFSCVLLVGAFALAPLAPACDDFGYQDTANVLAFNSYRSAPEVAFVSHGGFSRQAVIVNSGFHNRSQAVIVNRNFHSRPQAVIVGGHSRSQAVIVNGRSGFSRSPQRIIIRR